MDRIVALTEDLIRFRFTHDRPAEIQRCAAFVENRLQTDRAAAPAVRPEPEPRPFR